MNLYALLIYDRDYKLQYNKYNWDQLTWGEQIVIKVGLGKIESIVETLIKKSSPNNYYNIQEKFGDREVAIWVSSHDGHQIIIVNITYPKRMALQFLNSLISNNPSDIDLEQLFEYYSNPPKVDTIVQIRDELADTKVIMIHNIEELIARQESIEELLAKSATMVDNSNSFKIKARDLNSCCLIF
jgi:hypothetical protein